jgi:hypothetical protein
MDAPPAESRTFLHRVLRWIAIVALALGLLQVVTLIVYTVSSGFPYDRYWLPNTAAAISMSAMRIASAAILVVGGWGLLRWKYWGRVVLIVWSVLSILLALASTIGSVVFISREVAATTQPTGQSNAGLMIWTSVHHWLDNCALPVLFLAALFQPEAAKMWAGPKRGGFDVIPMANVVDDTRDAGSTEVAR